MCSKHKADNPPCKPTFVSMPQAAEILGLKLNSLRHYRSARPEKIPPYVRQGGKIAFNLDCLLDWAAQEKPLDLKAISQRAEALR